MVGGPGLANYLVRWLVSSVALITTIREKRGRTRQLGNVTSREGLNPRDAVETETKGARRRV